MKGVGGSIAVASAVLAGGSVALADCTSYEGQSVAAYIEPAVFKIQTEGNGACSGNGTGFVIAPEGLVITAKHVVPQECDGERIIGIFENNPTKYPLKVVQRSGLDVALLEFVDPKRKFPALAVMRPIANEAGYRGKDVVITSYYADLPVASSTTARIDSTVIIGQADEWQLCSVAANEGRSGSPVAMPDGTVVAVFTERPGNEQDVARVVPLADVADIDVLKDASPEIRFLSAPGNAISVGVGLTPVFYDFNLDASVEARHRLGETAGRYVFKNSEFTRADGLSILALLAETKAGAVVRYEDAQTRVYNAPAGYVFDSSVLSLHVSSHNPIQAPLPTKACGPTVSIDCYEFSSDRRHLTLRFRLFAGTVPLDRAHSWLSASVTTRLVPTQLAGPQTNWAVNHPPDPEPNPLPLQGPNPNVRVPG